MGSNQRGSGRSGGQYSYRIGCVVVVPQLVDQETADNHGGLTITKANSGNGLEQTLADEILCYICEVIRPRDICVIEQVLTLSLGLIAVTQEEFEEVKEAQELKLLNGTLRWH